jgi:hypothetical protein
MSTETSTPVWVPRGHPVRNFVVAVIAIALAAAALGGSGLTRPRIETAFASGEGNIATKRFSYTVTVRNQAPLAVRVVGVAGRRVVVDPGFDAVTVDGGETVEVTVSGRVECGPVRYARDGERGIVDNDDHALSLLVRPPLGVTRTVGSDGLNSAMAGICEPPPSPN